MIRSTQQQKTKNKKPKMERPFEPNAEEASSSLMSDGPTSVQQWVDSMGLLPDQTVPAALDHTIDDGGGGTADDYDPNTDDPGSTGSTDASHSFQESLPAAVPQHVAASSSAYGADVTITEPNDDDGNVETVSSSNSVPFLQELPNPSPTPNFRYLDSNNTDPDRALVPDITPYDHNTKRSGKRERKESEDSCQTSKTGTKYDKQPPQPESYINEEPSMKRPKNAATTPPAVTSSPPMESLLNDLPTDTKTKLEHYLQPFDRLLQDVKNDKVKEILMPFFRSARRKLRKEYHDYLKSQPEAVVSLRKRVPPEEENYIAFILGPPKARIRKRDTVRVKVPWEKPPADFVLPEMKCSRKECGRTQKKATIKAIFMEDKW